MATLTAPATFGSTTPTHRSEPLPTSRYYNSYGMRSYAEYLASPDAETYEISESTFGA